MKSSRSLALHTRRDAWVEINLTALEQNALFIKKTLPPPVQLMAVVKADAYGHGTIMTLPTLTASGVTMAGVASMDEALQIRDSGFELPVLVLGVTPDWAMQYALENDIQLTIFTRQHLSSLKQLFDASRIPIQVQIKVDTGMHRIGVPWEDAAEFIKHCQTLSFLTVQGVFSHLAHTQNESFTNTQISRWESVLHSLEAVPPLVHLGNSAAVTQYPIGPNNLVRVGIAFWGYSEDASLPSDSLIPVMGLKARIVHLHDLPSEEGVGYSQTFYNNTPSPRRIATLPLGYADGVPRNLSNKIHGLYQGKRIPQVGNISMDQLMMDVTDVSDAQVGDVITLIGQAGQNRISLNDWAEVLQTIPYELMGGLRVRLPKTYVR